MRTPTTYLTVNPEYIYTSNIIQTEQVLYRYIYMYIYACKNHSWKKEAMNLKGNKEGYMGELGERIGNRENDIIVLKIKNTLKKKTKNQCNRKGAD